jgi:acetyl-CoA carboxylase biotin carboxyl carrier protein
MGLFDKKADFFELMEKFEKSCIAEIEIETGENCKIKMSKQMTAAPVYIPDNRPYQPHIETSVPATIHTIIPAIEDIEKDDAKLIEAPIIGTFYSAPSPESAPFVKVGDTVSKGAIVCILEAMKVMNEVECEHDCEIVEILAKDGDVIQYGQPLFRIK